jgi:ribosomal protein S27E
MEFIEVECKYCGSIIEMSKAVKLNLETKILDTLTFQKKTGRK